MSWLNKKININLKPMNYFIRLKN